VFNAQEKTTQKKKLSGFIFLCTRKNHPKIKIEWFLKPIKKNKEVGCS